jgi:hypothetical protein
MRVDRLVGLATVLVLLGACMSMPPVVKRAELPRGADIAVVSFRDCTIAGQEDCDGSGNTAGSIFARVLATGPGFRAVPLSRPVGPKETLTDDAAVEFAKSKGFQYVMNGEVEDYYRVAPFTFRTERAGVSVRVLRVSDGTVMAFFSQRTHSQSNLTTPERLIEKMAEHVRASL